MCIGRNSKLQKGRKSENFLPLFLVTQFLCVAVLSWVRLFTTHVAGQAPLSMGFPRREYWSGLLLPSPGDLPDPGTEPAPLASLALAAGFLPTAPPGKPHSLTQRQLLFLVPFVSF